MTTATAVREDSLLFNGAMVRAILDGRKGMTRRVISPRNSEFGSVNTRRFWDHADFDAPHPGTLIDGSCGDGEYLHVPCHCQDRESNYPLAHPVPGCPTCKEWGWEGTRHRLYCRWKVGDRLWVRESIRWSSENDNFYFFADNQGCDHKLYQRLKRRSIASIHMPRWASRITLEITGIGVERLRDISKEDIVAEGFPCHSDRDAFGALWDSINGKRPGCDWASSPWVWKISFKRIKP